MPAAGALDTVHVAAPEGVRNADPVASNDASSTFGARATAVLLAVSVGLAWLALGQDTLFLSDGHFLIEQLRSGEFRVDRHRLDAPLFSLWWALTGLDPQRAITSLSAVSAALATWLVVGLARRQGAGPRRALLAGGLFAATPSVTFFATTTERHGLFLPFVAVTFAAAHGWLRRLAEERRLLPALGGTVLVGALAALATMVHNSGLVLVPAAATLFGLQRIRGPRDLLLGANLCGAALAIQLVLWRGGVAVLETYGWCTPHAPAPYLESGLLPRLAGGFAHLPRSLWHEWLLPFAPLSLLVWWSARTPQLRREAAGLGLALLGYLFLCGAVDLAHAEFGAYVLPLAIPVATLLARARPPAVPILGLVVATTAALLHVAHADVDRNRLAPYAAAVRQLAADRPMRVLVLLNPRIDHIACDLDEMAACVATEPPLDHVDLSALAQVDAISLRGHAPLITALVTTTPAGGRTFVSRRTLEILEQHPERHPSGPVLVQLLRERFELVPRALEPFDGFELVVR